VGDACARRTEAREVHPIAWWRRAPPGLVRAFDAAVGEPERGRVDPSPVVANQLVEIEQFVTGRQPAGELLFGERLRPPLFYVVDGP
jgi:hypothetical protein